MNEDLISRSALRAEIESYVMPILTNNLMGASDAYYRILHLLDGAPAVDAEKVCEQMGLVKEAMDMAKAYLRPVRHGRWEVKRHKLFGNSYDYVCSACGCDYALAEYNYCPHCGAKMDGET